MVDAVQLKDGGMTAPPASAVAKVPKPTTHRLWPHAPSGEGEGDADGERRCSRTARPASHGDLGLIGDGTHHVTHEQGEK